MRLSESANWAPTGGASQRYEGVPWLIQGSAGKEQPALDKMRRLSKGRISSGASDKIGANDVSSTDNDDVYELKEGVLEKWWKHALALAWVVYICFQVGFGIDHAVNGEQSLCPYNDENFPGWYYRINYCVVGGFVLIFLVLLIKIISIDPGNHRVPLIINLHIVGMGLVSAVISIIVDTGGICVDVLGVASPASVWGEWIAAGPLLMFITLSIVSKPVFSRMDWLIIITFDACLWAGLFIIPKQPVGSGAFWLVVSCLGYLPTLYLPWLEVTGDSAVAAQLDYASSSQRFFQVLSTRYAQRTNLIRGLTIILPLFTVNYLVALAKGYGPAATICIYQVLSCLTKGLFSSASMDIHLSLLIESERALFEERRANEARRAFMKFIFHEVRTPLNSLTMGIDLIASSPNIDATDNESLEIMRNASNFMSKTLDGVLSMHRAEEGKFDLDLSPTSIATMVRTTISTFYGTVLAKEINISSTCSPFVPPFVLADSVRLEHVLSNLVHNAIKFAPRNGIVRVSIECISRTQADPSGKPERATISITVEDNGPGIALEHQQKLFRQFVQIRPSSLQAGQGSGLGLSFVKTIVDLHGGEVNVLSSPGMGAVFRVIIPFTVVANEGHVVVDEEKPALEKQRAALAAAASLKFPNPTAPTTAPSPPVGAIPMEPAIKTETRPAMAVAQAIDDAPIRSDVSKSSTLGLGSGPSTSSSNSNAGTVSAPAPILQFMPRENSFSGKYGGGVVRQASQTISEDSEDVVVPEKKLSSLPDALNTIIETMTLRDQIRKENSSSIPSRHEVLHSSFVGEDKSKPFSRHELEVLVVDDADSNRKILMMLLARKKIRCVGAEDGKEAVDMVAKEPQRFKLILMVSSSYPLDVGRPVPLFAAPCAHTSPLHPSPLSRRTGQPDADSHRDSGCCRTAPARVPLRHRGCDGQRE